MKIEIKVNCICMTYCVRRFVSFWRFLSRLSSNYFWRTMFRSFAVKNYTDYNANILEMLPSLPLTFHQKQISELSTDLCNIHFTRWRRQKIIFIFTEFNWVRQKEKTNRCMLFITTKNSRIELWIITNEFLHKIC